MIFKQPARNTNPRPGWEARARRSSGEILSGSGPESGKAENWKTGKLENWKNGRV
jgi:hypothetical protein